MDPDYGFSNYLNEERKYSFDYFCQHIRYYSIVYWVVLAHILGFMFFSYIFLVIIPKDSADSPHFQIDSIHTSLLSSDDENLTFKSNFTFSIPKLFHTETIRYNFDSVSLFQDDVLISNTTMNSIFQADYNTTRVKAGFVLGPTPTQINEVVEWTVEIKATLILGPDTYRRIGPCQNFNRNFPSAECISWINRERTAGYFRERKRSARVRCRHVKVDFSTNSTNFGRLLNPPSVCVVYYDNSVIW